MIPLYLSLSGFLSYRDPTEIDFSAFDLACISGANGAGKSSLLDAITWVLFGQARKRDDSVINTQSSSAEVTLTFAYESNVYRLQRVKPRDKTMMLEFYILQNDGRQAMEGMASPVISHHSSLLNTSTAGKWKPLTERTLRETETRIQQTLRLDYDTFVNASFFLQGKADQFTQQRPGDRKRILGSILGLEVWEGYRQRASDNRRQVETKIDVLDGQLREIVAELSEEQARRQRLKELETDLERLSKERASQDALLAAARQLVAALAEQQKLVDTKARYMEEAKQRLQELQLRLEQRCAERDTYNDLLVRATEVEAVYAAWQEMRAELGRLDEVATRFREHEKRREEPRLEIQAARARLEQEMEALLVHQQRVEALAPEVEGLRAERQAASDSLSVAEAQLARRVELDANLQASRQRQVDAKAENARLKADMEALKKHIDDIIALDSAECPYCGQPLSAEHRQKLTTELETEGKQMGDRFRTNQELVHDLENEIARLLSQLQELTQAEVEVIAYNQTLAQVQSRLDVLETQRAAWETDGALRLGVIQQSLQQESYASEWRARLAQIDAELKEIGYDAAAHDAIRQAETEGRASEAAMRTLEKAQAVLAPLEREIDDLKTQVSAEQAQVMTQTEEHSQAAERLEAARAQAPDLDAAERDVFELQERENRLRIDVGAARQRVLILDDLKVRRKSLEAEREVLAVEVRQYKQLERAFGKDGVPALLIEQALPEIEARANELLDRLSGGNMSVRFVTQSAYKDKRREDLRETLDIQISDTAGTRDYEMFSGGEAFRVNFAIRLALSEVLAQRAGARLQTLVVDEGFGSQDAQGRQRLIEAINLVRSDFAKILVITHIDELKDAFPNRIEVEKTDRGSVLQVI